MTTEQKIQKIWEERINQRIDSSLILFAEVKKDLGLKNSESFSEFSFYESIDLKIYCECLALESSLARAQRNKDLVEKAISRIEKDISPAISLMSFNFQFEKAINSFASSEWIDAVHYFLKAKNLAVDSLQKATCLFNLILCSENLDISYSQSLLELTNSLQHLEPGMRKGIETQLDALNLRNKWRESVFNENDFTSLALPEITQSSFFLSYIGQIPYLKNHLPENHLEAFVKKPGHLFNKDFRLRTLTFQWSENDAKAGRLIDHIERIYLWTWKWIENPHKFTVTNLMKSLQAFPWKEIDHIDKLALDNQSMLLLSIGWLSLFDYSMSSIYESLAKKVKFTGNNKMLICERNILLQLAKNKYASELSAYNSIEKDILNVLQKFENKTIQSVANNCYVTVDLSKHIIKSEARMVHSKSLSTAIGLLIDNENMDLEIFFNKTLSSIEYDHFLNAPQISNLIFKINQLLSPSLVVKQKNGLIFTTGNKKAVALFYGDTRAQLLASTDEWSRLVQSLRREFSLITENKLKNRNRKLIIMQTKFVQFNRQTLQRELSLSKTEAVRLLQSWIGEKLIVKKGYGKKIIYTFKNLQSRTA